ncbi:unnamed protein product [Colias eurytheme]|nr:unnamed protein product [Colias eurytheme]
MNTELLYEDASNTDCYKRGDWLEVPKCSPAAAAALRRRALTQRISNQRARAPPAPRTSAPLSRGNTVAIRLAAVPAVTRHTAEGKHSGMPFV